MKTIDLFCHCTYILHHAVSKKKNKSSNDSRDQIMFGLKNRPKLGKTKTRQCSTTERNLLVDPDDLEIKKKPLNMREESWKGAEDAALPCKKDIHTGDRKLAAEVTASHNFPKTIFGCTVESHESTRQRVEPPLPGEHEDHIAGRGKTSSGAGCKEQRCACELGVGVDQLSSAGGSQKEDGCSAKRITRYAGV